ncbi:MAG: cell division protein FtsZ [Bacteroidetes Order II. Incertae sedis bacterium]|nr:cell division protein FtsZ [Bacteroidetes Order II. bacterium]
MNTNNTRSTGEERPNNPISNMFTYVGDELNKDAVIRVIGVGGGGGNALNNMAKQGIKGIEFVAVNTDAQDLMANKAHVKIQAGRSLTKGLGAGARPDIGAQAVEEARQEVEQALKGCDMVFITAGMGGGTGTGGAPAVAQIARKMDILTVAIVTRPFTFEGRKRMQFAMQGIDALKQYVDALIVIPNDRVVDVIETNTPVEVALAKVDEVLYNSTRGISDLITTHGLINLDFADVKTIMKDGGMALIGSAVASGENRAEKAAMAAIRSPLLDGLSIRNAKSVLVNITAGRSLTIKEATVATEIIKKEVGDDIGEDEIIFGMVVSEEMGDDLRVTVVATRFDEVEDILIQPKKSIAEVATPTAIPEVSAPAQPLMPPSVQEPPTTGQHAPRTETLPRREFYHTVPAYKGEQALKDLDVPAYQRRLGVNPAEETPQPPPAPTPDERSPAMKILRLSAEDRNAKKAQPKRDDDNPTFLRNMMD